MVYRLVYRCIGWCTVGVQWVAIVLKKHKIGAKMVQKYYRMSPYLTRTVPSEL